jgi:ribonuclease Z
VQLTFLGTVAGAPTRDRNVTALALRFGDGGWWLVDCGEATQHRVREAGLKAGRLDRILITHLHGDHCWGLPGMLMAAAIAERRDPIQVAGPRGLARLLDGTLGTSSSELPYPLDVIELDEDPRGKPLPGDGWRARPFAIRHRVPCVAYLIEEPPRPGRFHPERAAALGVADRRLFGRLQRGEAIDLPDGSRIRPEQVLDPAPPPRRVLVCGDTDDADAVIPHARRVDVVVREATYAGDREPQARQWGHSTATMTGRFAAALGARHLIVTHVGGRHADGDAAEELRREAAEACPETNVLVAHDLMTWAVPVA